MARDSTARSPRASLTPAGTFVVQVRSDSDLRRRRLRGRVEHVVSGRSEQFDSLQNLLAFIARHTRTIGAASTEGSDGQE